jgi:hypothetical protein
VILIMRWFINYLRQCFCQHDFNKEIIEVYYSNFGVTSDFPEYHKVILECKKCGYHIKYKK